MDVYKYVFEKVKLYKLALADDAVLTIGKAKLFGSSEVHDGLVMLTDIIRQNRQKPINFKLDGDGNAFRIQLSGSLRECFLIETFHSSSGMITYINMQNIHNDYFGPAKKR